MSIPNPRGRANLAGRLRRSYLMRVLRAPRRLDALEARLSQLETRWHESGDEVWERSRARWRAAKPDAALTWSKTISGHPFVSKVAEYGALGPTRTVVEVGPGYGRLLQALIERGESFREYRGIDLSAENVAYLKQQFAQGNVAFSDGDIETVDLGPSVETVISSLTFKHLFPSFERALQNIAQQLLPGGMVIFDLIEGSRRHFEDDGVTYIRSYSRDEVRSILTSAGLELTAFDEVYHLPGRARLLVVARRGDDAVKPGA
jgi:SAM-dependent methyltransferase